MEISRFFRGMTAAVLLWPTVVAAGRENRITPAVRAVADVMPSVVNISTERMVAENGEPDKELFAEMPSGSGARQEHSLGSGCIIDSAGLVVTCEHVVRRASMITVTLADGTRHAARKLAGDEVNDLALLRIEGVLREHPLPPIRVAEPGDLLLGETVIVVGNPFGLGSSISSGVLSAVGRKVVFQGRVVFDDLLQIDATVYPGNSGGPLINLDAEMIGLSAALHREASGISFAIPLQRVVNTMAKWLIPERFSNASLGIVPAIEREPDGRLRIFLQDVLVDSPAWKAGLRAGDTLTAVNREPVNNLPALSRNLWRMKAGDRIGLKLADGREVELRAEKYQLDDGRLVAKMRLGLGVRQLNPELAAALGYPLHEGVVVSEPDYSAGSGIARGDLLVQIGDVAIHHLQDIARALRNRFYGDNVPVIVVGITRQDDGYYLTRKFYLLKVR